MNYIKCAFSYSLCVVKCTVHTERNVCVSQLNCHNVCFIYLAFNYSELAFMSVLVSPGEDGEYQSVLVLEETSHTRCLSQSQSIS